MVILFSVNAGVRGHGSRLRLRQRASAHHGKAPDGVGSMGSAGIVHGKMMRPYTIFDINDEEDRNSADVEARIYSQFNPADCLLQAPNDIAGTELIGKKLAAEGHYKASSKCMRLAMQSWFAGIQKQPQIFLNKKAPTPREIREATKALTFDYRDVLKATGAAVHDDADADAQRPQIPPQLLFEHKQKRMKNENVPSEEHQSAHKPSGDPSVELAAQANKEAERKPSIAPTLVRKVINELTDERNQIEKERHKDTAGTEDSGSQTLIRQLPKGDKKMESAAAKSGLTVEGLNLLKKENPLLDVTSLANMSPLEQMKELQKMAMNPHLQKLGTRSSGRYMGPYARGWRL